MNYRHDQQLNHRDNRAALFEGAKSGRHSPLSAASNSGQSAMDLESQNDDRIEGLTDKVKLLKEITLSIGDSVKESNDLIAGMSDDYGRTGTFMGQSMSRLKVLATTQSGQFICFWTFIVVVVLIFVYYALRW